MTEVEITSCINKVSGEIKKTSFNPPPRNHFWGQNGKLPREQCFFTKRAVFLVLKLFSQNSTKMLQDEKRCASTLLVDLKIQQGM